MSLETDPVLIGRFVVPIKVASIYNSSAALRSISIPFRFAIHIQKIQEDFSQSALKDEKSCSKDSVRSLVRLGPSLFEGTFRQTISDSISSS